jgi:penicillin-binding protein 2
MSIGQGDLTATPLQVARYAAVFANGGKLVTPTLLHGNKSKFSKEGFLKEQTVNTIRQGMYESTYGAKIAGQNYAGKTGTAESGQAEPHAWYTSFAPYPNAEISVAVMVEHAGHGLVVSTPVAKQIYEWWFTHRN